MRGLLMKWVVLAAMLCTARAGAAQDGAIRGRVLDQLGGAVPGAQVSVVRDGQSATSATADGSGAFAIDGLAEGRYQLLVVVAGFAEQASEPVFVPASGRVSVDVNLQISPLQDNVLVTAAAGTVTQAQTGASATVLDATLLETLGNTDLLEPVRSVPGVAVVQTGARGAQASLFVRGGASNFNKILIDGIPANDIGGDFDISTVMTTGIERVEIMRGSNSVTYGSDALTSVVNIATRAGRTRVPEATFSIDGGNFATSHEEASIGGASGRFDYFGTFGHLQTDNRVENNDFRNDTFATRLGVALGANTRVSGTLRVIDTTFGSPNAVNFYGISDDSRLDKRNVFGTILAEVRHTERWQSLVRFGVNDQDYTYVNPSPTGTPGPFGNYLGGVVTIHGPEGRSVTGRAILDYAGEFPSPYRATVRRNFVYGQTGYQVSTLVNLTGGFRLEHSRGTSEPGFQLSDGNEAIDEATRTNYGGFVEARAAALGHLFITGGLGVDNNETFGVAVSPRVSVAAYLRPPSSGMVGDTKVTFNAGRGVKEPSVSQQLSSLFDLVQTNAPALGVDRISPEKSRTIDVGVEQALAGGKARVRVAFYDNAFTDQLEYVSRTVLPQLGVPTEVANATGFGAYVNGQSSQSKGVELSGDALVGSVKVTASYTYADVVVTESFGSAALFPAENPAFPGIRIGQYAPLVGARPFRRPAHSGSAILAYTRDKAGVALAGYFFGRADDSTYLSDEFFGYSMLLPNTDLAPAYQKFDVSGFYRVHPRVRTYVTLENLSNEQFASAAGFPALPRAVRIGAAITVGGR
jgi:vitamin B12 transporter